MWFHEIVDGAVWTCARSDLRRRWMSWAVLGLLAGTTVGLAAAGFAGARRVEPVISNYLEAADVPEAAVLANSPAYDEAVRAEVARLPDVEATAPFQVSFLLEVTSPAGMEAPLLPTRAGRFPIEPLVVGRSPDPQRADEIAINEPVSNQFDLDLGDTATIVQPAVEDPGEVPYPVPPGASEPLEATLRVVGIYHSVDGEPDSQPSPAFYQRHQAQLAGPVNEFVYLRDGADLAAFQAGVAEIMGQPVNVESAEDLFQLRATYKVADVERGALVLFAVAALLGGGVLVGQALVRAVTAGAADLPTWRALGFDRRMAATAIAVPAAIAAVVGAVTTVTVAIAMSPRFPVAFTRRFLLDTSVHADWLIIGAAAAVVVLAVAATAWTTAWLTVRFGVRSARRPPALALWAGTLALPAPMIVGTRLAVEPGRGKRAVPVRSALVGAVAGVLGVVACLTMGRGLTATVGDPARAGVTWDLEALTEGDLTPETVDAVVADENVANAMLATWVRAVEMDGRSVPAFGTTQLVGEIDFVVLDGRAPVAPDEVAMAPVTMDQLGVDVGDEIGVGPGSAVRAEVVGRVLLPATSHTSYDQSAWMTAEGLGRVLPLDLEEDPGERGVLLDFRPGADLDAEIARIQALDLEYVETPERPPAVEGLGNIRSLPVALAVFFALIAVATVAHALVTTVRRRKRDLAVLRSMGLTRRDSRLAIVWQSTLLAIVGLVIGVPLGIAVGRFLWRQIAESFPVVYVSPLALFAMVVVVPTALLIANLLAAGPARAATRIHPAEVLRTE
jgi:hypothetical protein